MAFAEFAFDDADEDDDAAIGIEPGVENEGAEGSVDTTAGRGHLLDDLLEDIFDADA